MNNVKVFVLMAGLTALLVTLGGMLGGNSGLAMMLLFSAAMNFFMYFASSSLVLRMYGARVVTAQEAPRLYAIVDRLRQRAGLPMPTVAIAPHAQPNAFATGRNPEHAVVCVTEGILELVSDEELEGVLAHELAHVKNRDMLLSTIAATMAGAIGALGRVVMFAGIFGGRDDRDRNPIGELVAIIVAPVAAMLIQFAISRQREYKADAVGAQISGRPLELASALTKLDAYAHRIPMQVPPAVAPLAQVNPFAGMNGGLLNLFSTHPPTEKRVAALRALASGG
ncbi:MAG: zinc metalloprotease HtpX [Gemmatimonadaceae bacterium]|nr:zinc metalloprotease HtpX [Gemmatimonadaceae bacterium]